MSRCHLARGGHEPVTAGTFATAEIVLCEPAFNGSVMADISGQSPRPGARTALKRAISSTQIEELSE